jgi:hypothetical protein
VSQLTAAGASERTQTGASRWSRALWLGLWALAALLIVPGLCVGPVFDDWFHQFDAHEPVGTWQPLFGLYDFFDAGQVAELRGYGVLPWWSDDRLSISFFRPLSSLLLNVNHHWLDGGGFWSHVHAALWFAAVVLAAARVSRLLFGWSEARWGSALFALSSAHVMSLTFVASLHAHVTALFALLSFECLIRAGEAARGGAGSGARLQAGSALCFLVALAAGESALRVPATDPTCWLTLNQGELVPLDPRSPRDWTPTPKPR